MLGIWILENIWVVIEFFYFSLVVFYYGGLWDKFVEKVLVLDVFRLNFVFIIDREILYKLRGNFMFQFFRLEKGDKDSFYFVGLFSVFGKIFYVVYVGWDIDQSQRFALLQGFSLGGVVFRYVDTFTREEDYFEYLGDFNFKLKYFVLKVIRAIEWIR